MKRFSLFLILMVGAMSTFYAQAMETSAAETSIPVSEAKVSAIAKTMVINTGVPSLDDSNDCKHGTTEQTAAKDAKKEKEVKIKGQALSCEDAEMGALMASCLKLPRVLRNCLYEVHA